MSFIFTNLSSTILCRREKGVPATAQVRADANFMGCDGFGSYPKANL